MSRWTSLLVPTSMPRVGSSMISSRGSRGQPLGEHHLLLVAAGERGDGVLLRAGLDLEPLAPFLGRTPLGARR